MMDADSILQFLLALKRLKTGQATPEDVATFARVVRELGIADGAALLDRYLRGEKGHQLLGELMARADAPAVADLKRAADVLRLLNL